MELTLRRERPIRVAIVNDYEVVVAGLARMLEFYLDRIELVQLAANASVDEYVDIVLYDTYSQPQIDHIDIQRVLRNPKVERLVIYSWNVQPQLVAFATAKGVAGYVSKTVPASVLVDAMEMVVAGEFVLRLGDEDEPIVGGEWPGRAEGLTHRESEVIALVVQGLTNKEIAERTYLSINSVKSYLKSSFRKMRVTSRSQAVGWGVRHGFEPDVVRLRDPEAVLD